MTVANEIIMAEAKTRPTDASVDDYLDGVTPEKKRVDSFVLREMMARASGYPPRMWGESMVGYGAYHYTYASGHEGDYFVTGFAPRKQNLVVYIMPGFSQFGRQMKRLGKYKTGKSCLYINKLADVDMDVLEEIVRLSVDWMVAKYGAGRGRV